MALLCLVWNSWDSTLYKGEVVVLLCEIRSSCSAAMCRTSCGKLCVLNSSYSTALGSTCVMNSCSAAVCNIE